MLVITGTRRHFQQVQNLKALYVPPAEKCASDLQQRTPKLYAKQPIAYFPTLHELKLYTKRSTNEQ